MILEILIILALLVNIYESDDSGESGGIFESDDLDLFYIVMLVTLMILEIMVKLTIPVKVVNLVNLLNPVILVIQLNLVILV